jgi:hypothetical protein
MYCFSKQHPATYTQNIRGCNFTIVNTNPDINDFLKKKYANKKYSVSTSEQDICIEKKNVFTIEGLCISTSTKIDYYLPKITKKPQNHYLVDLKDLQFIEEKINY